MPRLSTAESKQLRRLLEANRQAVEHLDLPRALYRIVEAAVELVGADGGAIGVLGRDGSLDRLVHTGLDDDMVARISAWPADGHPESPVRDHPARAEVLAVPLRVRDEVFGHLSLVAERGGSFSQDDRALVDALAGTAGVAVSHARMFEESTRRERWTAATSEITDELLTNDDVDALQLVADRVCELATADSVTVVLSHGTIEPYEGLVVDRAGGRGAAGLRGRGLVAGDNPVRACLLTRRPQLAESMPRMPYRCLPGDQPEETGPAMVVPLVDGRGVRGAILVVRSVGSPHFAELDLDVVASLAGHAALALDRADARAVTARSRTREDRDRIARDLHDHAVQRLFAVGLHLEAVRGALGETAESDRLEQQVEEIDATIRQIRTTIFSLGASGRTTGLRALVLEVVAAATGTGTLPGPPDVTFRGPIDLLVPTGMHTDASAVLREALSNIGRHAGAGQVSVSVTATPAELVIVVLDDGRGIGAGVTLSGLENLRRRALARGGEFALSGRDGPGTRLSWSAPLEDEAA